MCWVDFASCFSCCICCCWCIVQEDIINLILIIVCHSCNRNLRSPLTCRNTLPECIRLSPNCTWAAASRSCRWVFASWVREGAQEAVHNIFKSSGVFSPRAAQTQALQQCQAEVEVEGVEHLQDMQFYSQSVVERVVRGWVLSDFCKDTVCFEHLRKRRRNP